MEKNKTISYLLAIAAIVAVAGIVVLILNNGSEITSPEKTALLDHLFTNPKNDEVIYWVTDENGMTHIETMNDKLWKDQILQTIKEREAEGYPVEVISFSTTKARTCYYVASDDIPASDGVGFYPGEIGIFCFREDGLLVTKPAFSLHENTIYVEGYSVDAETNKKLDDLYVTIQSKD